MLDLTADILLRCCGLVWIGVGLVLILRATGRRNEPRK